MKNRSSLYKAALILVPLLTAACTTTDPYTREEKVSKATWGSFIGGASGAAIGALSGDNGRERRKRALLGAGVGALAGGAVGYYMDRQEAILRSKLEGTGVSVSRVGDTIVLNMPGNVTFATGRAEVKSEFYGVLESVALVLDEYNKTLVEITGHTDSVGAAEYNQTLSENRAQSVGSYLRSQGIPQERMLTYGQGEYLPIGDNDTPSGRQRNRRVELVLVPLTA